MVFEKLKKNVAISKKRERSRSHLFVECLEEKDILYADKLLDKNIDLKEPVVHNKRRNSVLCHAIGAGNLSITKKLIDKGADVNARVDNQKTPLEMAIFKNDANVVRELFASGAQASGGLLFAVQHNKLDVAQMLVNIEGAVHRCDDAGNTPLHYAVKHGKIGLVRLLLLHGADPQAKNSAGESCVAVNKSSDHAFKEQIMLLLVTVKPKSLPENATVEKKLQGLTSSQKAPVGILTSADKRQLSFSNTSPSIKARGSSLLSVPGDSSCTEDVFRRESNSGSLGPEELTESIKYHETRIKVHENQVKHLKRKLCLKRTQHTGPFRRIRMLILSCISYT